MRFPSAVALAAAALSTFSATAYAAVAANASGAFVQFCSPDNAFCIAAIPSPAANPTTVTFAMWSSTASWLGFGIGKGMADADIYIGWTSGTGKMVVSDRTSTSQSTPVVDPTQQITILRTVPAALAGVVPTTAKTMVVFQRTVTANPPNKLIAKGPSDYIWATGQVRPGEAQNGAVAKHDAYSSFKFDPLTLGSVATGGAGAAVNIPNAKLIHGVLMVVAWVVCPFAGIFVARYLKDVMGKWWYYTHLGLMLVGATLIGSVGIIIVSISNPPEHFIGGLYGHKTIGLVIGIDAVLQTVLGFICNHLWSPDRRGIPWWDQVHWWNGRALWLLSLANVYIGMLIFGTPLGYIIAFFVVVGISFAALVAGQFYFGAVHHVAKDDGGMKNMEIGRPYDDNMGYNPNGGYGGGGGYSGYNR